MSYYHFKKRDAKATLGVERIVFPDGSLLDPVSVGLGGSIFGGHGPLEHAFSKIRSDGSHDWPRKLGRVGFLTLKGWRRILAASLGPHVLDVHGVSTDAEMGGVAARRIVARMHDMGVWWYFDAAQFEGRAMGVSSTKFPSKPAISMRMSTSSPRPTIIWPGFLDSTIDRASETAKLLVDKIAGIFLLAMRTGLKFHALSHAVAPLIQSRNFSTV